MVTNYKKNLRKNKNDFIVSNFITIFYYNIRGRGQT